MYNMTNVTNMAANGIGDYVCQVNYLTDKAMAICLLILIIITALIIMLQFDYVIYTALPVSFFMGSLIALVFRLWQCNGQGMISTKVLMTVWILTAIFVGLRKVVKD